VAPPPAPVDSLAGIKVKILAWDRKSHAGSRAALTEEEINELTQWAEQVTSRSGKSTAFNVIRGEGTGDYVARDQVKIISIHGNAVGGKQPTYHITLRE
jgi:Holliday junction resolvase